MEINTIIYILIAHFIGDFIFQSNYMALNKSSSNKVLFLHILTYSIPLLVLNVYWAILNSLLHFIVDYVTSRVNKRLWELENKKYFS